jgi:hypothetical protein
VFHAQLIACAYPITGACAITRESMNDTGDRQMDIHETARRINRAAPQLAAAVELNDWHKAASLAQIILSDAVAVRVAAERNGKESI